MKIQTSLALALALFLSSCKWNPIDYVAVEPSENLETIRVSAFLAKTIQLDFSALFQIKDYGSVFANPFTPEKGAEIGLLINTAIVDDQDFVKLEPTTVLPNGMPLGLDVTMVEIRKPTPINAHYDINAYVDVLHRDWVGTSVMLTSLSSNAKIIAGASFSKGFMANPQGSPMIIASVFGPKMNKDGTVAVAGGVALFANVRELIAQAKTRAHPNQAVVAHGL